MPITARLATRLLLGGRISEDTTLFVRARSLERLGSPENRYPRRWTCVSYMCKIVSETVSLLLSRVEVMLTLAVSNYALTCYPAYRKSS